MTEQEHPFSTNHNLARGSKLDSKKAPSLPNPIPVHLERKEIAINAVCEGLEKIWDGKIPDSEACLKGIRRELKDQTLKGIQLTLNQVNDVLSQIELSNELPQVQEE